MKFPCFLARALGNNILGKLTKFILFWGSFLQKVKVIKSLRCHCQVFNHQTPSLEMVPDGETSRRVLLLWLSSASLPSLCSRYLSPVPVCHTKCHHGHSSVHHPITIIILTFTIVDLHYISKCVCHLLLILIEVFSRKCRGNPSLKRERVLIQCMARGPGQSCDNFKTGGKDDCDNDEIDVLSCTKVMVRKHKL